MKQPDTALPRPNPADSRKTPMPRLIGPAVQTQRQPRGDDGTRTVAGPLGHIRLPAHEQSAARARRFVREILTPRFLQVCDEAVLLVSELITNSVRHSDSAHRPGETLSLTLREPIPGTLPWRSPTPDRR